VTALPSPHDATLEAALGGDDAALALLVRAYHDRVYRFGVRVCRDPSDAEDAVQEAFFQLSRRPDVQRDAGVLAWLFVVVRRACLRLLRPFQRQRVHLGERDEEADPTSLDPGPEAALERWRLVHAVHAALAALPAEQREVIVLRDLEGLAGDEVSARLGLSEAAMKSRLHRARAMVRAALAAHG
jgi:RNA polymerase sigma-70 factor (ECF subfamily)